MRSLLFCICLSGLAAGCATTSMSVAPAVPIISYRLPRTVAYASGTLTIISCDRNEIELSSELTLTAEGQATGPEATLSAAQLDSLRFRRVVEVARHPNGTLASVNSVVEDKLPSIIGSVLKTALQILPMVSASSEPVQCSDDVSRALARLADIKDSVTKLKARLDAEKGDAEDLERRINALLIEASAIKQNRLTASFQEELPLAGGESTVDIRASLSDLAGGGLRPVVLQIKSPASGLTDASYACANQGSLCLPNPVLPSATWEVSVVAAGKALQSQQLVAPMPQWASPIELPLRVAFAGNRSFSAKYDQFGRQTSASWGSEARGAVIAEAVAGYAATATALKDEIDGPSLVDLEKSEIEKLETRQRLNRLRACRDILAGGGSACPAEAQPSNPPS